MHDPPSGLWKARSLIKQQVYEDTFNIVPFANSETKFYNINNHEIYKFLCDTPGLICGSVCIHINTHQKESDNQIKRSLFMVVF